MISEIARRLRTHAHAHTHTHTCRAKGNVVGRLGVELDAAYIRLGFERQDGLRLVCRPDFD